VPAKGKDTVQFKGASAAHIANRRKSFDFPVFYAANLCRAGIYHSLLMTFNPSFPQLTV
jgi:hypothetical protein